MSERIGKHQETKHAEPGAMQSDSDRVNATYKKHIRAVARELFAVERVHLKPLPVRIPDVCGSIFQSTNESERRV